MSQIHPDTKRDTKWMLIFLSRQGILFIFFSLIMHNIFLNLKENDFSQVCQNCSFAVLFVSTCFQQCIIIWKEQYLTELMNDIKKDYALAEKMPAKEQKIIQNYAKKSTNVCKLWQIISITGLGFFPLINIILITYYWIIGEFRLIPLYDLVYPSFIENKKDTLVIFFLTYILFLAFAGSCSLIITAFVPLGPSLMLHACGQLEVLKMEIEVCFKSENIEEVLKKFKKIIKQLKYIYAYVDLLTNTVACYHV